MQRRPPTDIADYLDIFNRRKWWIILPAIAIAVSVSLVSMKLPKFYRSTTLILVDPQKIPADYVKQTVSSDVTDRLQTLSQEILSRTRLQKIIDQFGLYKDQDGRMSKEDIIEMMSKDIKIDVVTEENSRTKSSAAFKISYTGKDPALVQQVTRQIASLFIEENLKVRQGQAEGTDAFISSELNKAAEALQEQENKIRAFKARNIGSLPEQQTANLQVLGQLQGLLQANSDAIGRAQQQKTYLESLLDAMNKRAPIVPKAGFQAELDSRRAELVAAEEKYTPSHPDVVRLKKEVKALEAKAATMAKAEAANTPSSDQPDQMKGQLLSIEQEIKDRTKRQSDLEGRIRGLQGRIDVLPTVEQQFSEINRDYLTSKANYESLLQKKNSSSMAAEMERHAKGEQFRILDPASFPEKPFKPDLMQLNMMGILGGLIVGGGLGMLFEFKDPSLHSDKDVAFLVPVRVLGTLPIIMTPTTFAAEKKKKKMGYAAGATAAVFALAMLAYAFKRSPQAFDPRGWF
jgi:polysaccharide biosynthesis transport protein